MLWQRISFNNQTFEWILLADHKSGWKWSFPVTCYWTWQVGFDLHGHCREETLIVESGKRLRFRTETEYRSEVSGLSGLSTTWFADECIMDAFIGNKWMIRNALLVWKINYEMNSVTIDRVRMHVTYDVSAFPNWRYFTNNQVTLEVKPRTGCTKL